MRRSDRRASSDDNERRHPQSRQKEPLSYHELRYQRDVARADKAALEKEKELLQQQVKTFQFKAEEWEQTAVQNEQRYLAEKKQHEHALCLYHEEKVRASELLAKYEEADAQRAHYLSLYEDTYSQLKHERRSKAGIKSWETRRKRENERLKKEIGEMVVLLQESMARKEEAVGELYDLAERMDRIQKLVDSVEGESTGNPVNLLQKMKRIWSAIREILAE